MSTTTVSLNNARSDALWSPNHGFGEGRHAGDEACVCQAAHIVGIPGRAHPAHASRAVPAPRGGRAVVAWNLRLRMACPISMKCILHTPPGVAAAVGSPSMPSGKALLELL